MKEGSLKVFIQEDDRTLRKKITQDLKQHNYRLHFFSKRDSVFDLLKFNPDILIQDYSRKKIVNCYEWNIHF